MRRRCSSSTSRARWRRRRRPGAPNRLERARAAATRGSARRSRSTSGRRDADRPRAPKLFPVERSGGVRLGDVATLEIEQPPPQAESSTATTFAPLGRRRARRATSRPGTEAAARRLLTDGESVPFGASAVARGARRHVARRRARRRRGRARLPRGRDARGLPAPTALGARRRSCPPGGRDWSAAWLDAPRPPRRASALRSAAGRRPLARAGRRQRHAARAVRSRALAALAAARRPGRAPKLTKVRTLPSAHQRTRLAGFRDGRGSRFCCSSLLRVLSSRSAGRARSRRATATGGLGTYARPGAPLAADADHEGERRPARARLHRRLPQDRPGIRRGEQSYPLVVGGRIYMTTNDNNVWALDATSGQGDLALQAGRTSPSSATSASSPTAASPTATAGLPAHARHDIVALDPADGKLLARVPVARAVPGAPRTTATRRRARRSARTASWSSAPPAPSTASAAS